MNKIFCCTVFENLIKEAGGRGIAILARQTDGDLKFVLQSRGIAADDEAKIRPLPIEIQINVSSELRLRFCPVCGAKLEDIIKSSPEAVAKLANDHKRFRTLEDF